MLQGKGVFITDGEIICNDSASTHYIYIEV